MLSKARYAALETWKRYNKTGTDNYFKKRKYKILNTITGLVNIYLIVVTFYQTCLYSRYRLHESRQVFLFTSNPRQLPDLGM